MINLSLLYSIKGLNEYFPVSSLSLFCRICSAIMCQNCIFDVPRHFTATFLVWVSNIAFVLILSPLPIKYMDIVILVLQ